MKIEIQYSKANGGEYNLFINGRLSTCRKDLEKIYADIEDKGNEWFDNVLDNEAKID